jgi:hypothetical protein
MDVGTMRSIYLLLSAFSEFEWFTLTDDSADLPRIVAVGTRASSTQLGPIKIPSLCMLRVAERGIDLVEMMKQSDSKAAMS